MTEKQHIAAIRKAHAKSTAALAVLDAAIRAAHPAVSLRKIAEAANLSHEQVRRIIQRAERS